MTVKSTRKRTSASQDNASATFAQINKPVRIYFAFFRCIVVMQARLYCTTWISKMAMLAEKKTKQKWSNDPRNTAWTNGTKLFCVIV